MGRGSLDSASVADEFAQWIADFGRYIPCGRQCALSVDFSGRCCLQRSGKSRLVVYSGVDYHFPNSAALDWITPTVQVAAGRIGLCGSFYVYVGVCRDSGREIVLNLWISVYAEVPGDGMVRYRNGGERISIGGTANPLECCFRRLDWLVGVLAFRAYKGVSVFYHACALGECGRVVPVSPARSSCVDVHILLDLLLPRACLRMAWWHFAGSTGQIGRGISYSSVNTLGGDDFVLSCAGRFDAPVFAAGLQHPLGRQVG